jgi:hypothetical protein
MTMQDRPRGVDILESVATFLRVEVLPSIEGTLAYRTRVAVNAIDLVRRETLLASVTNQELRTVIAGILGREGDDSAQLRALSEAIALGHVDRTTPGLLDLLWALATARLAVDQPNYPGLALARQLQSGTEKEPSDGL